MPRKRRLCPAQGQKFRARLSGRGFVCQSIATQTQKNIGTDPRQISMQLRMLLDNARYWAENGVYPPREAAARFHHRMVQIHPFPNGNGRHARIATDVMLEDYYDHPPIEWASGYDLQADNERRTAYIAALRAADAGEFEPLLLLVGNAEQARSKRP